MENETVAYPVLRCRRCGNARRGGKPWIARTAKKPKTCPDCKSPFWDREKMTAQERKRPFLARCPLCEWRAPFARQTAALKRVREHMEAQHGREATAKFLGLAPAGSNEVLPGQGVGNRS